MPKPRPPKGSWDTRAADVLAGRAAVDPGDLIDLIHEINPTGRGRGADETAARYALKSRLQSLLIDRFGDDLEVAPDPDDPAVVAIRHRYRRHDACHAVITSLDDDARSWVQREIDLQGPASEADESSRRPSAALAVAAGGDGVDDDDLSASELLAAGEEAQAAYDYERAQRCFSRAVGASGGGAAAAVAFLSFAVDAIAADEDALAVEARLPPATLADPRIALLLAVAAARAGDEGRALYHVGRTKDPRAAHVLALLGRHALDAGDAERAARHLRAAEGHDPAHPDLRALADGIAAARAAERSPHEAALGALVTAGRHAEALGAAQAILARWPESEPARRAARQMEERQREEAARRLVAEAEGAIAGGAAAAALEHLHRALSGPLPPADREAALRRVREIEAAERARAAQAGVDHAVALLAEAEHARVGGAGAPALERALGAYAELPDEGRAAVRARVALPALGWIDLIPAARPGGRIRPAVEAVVALQRAASLVDRDPAAAAAIVAAHDRLLDEVPLARSIEQRARAAASEEKARRAQAALREAEAALAGDHLAHAREVLDRLDARALSTDDRARAAALEARLAAAEERRREILRFEHLEAAGAFPAARAAAAALGERDGGQERERWAARASAIDERVRSRHAIKVDALSGGPELLQHAAFCRFARGSSAWVGDGSRELVLCACENAWMFLRFVDLDSGRVTRGVRVALAEPLHDANVFAGTSSVTVAGNSGLFELASPGGELLQRFERNWNRDRDLCFDTGMVPRGTRLLWGRYGIDDEVARVVDLDGEPGGKTFTGIRGHLEIVGADPPRLLLFRNWYNQADDEHTTLQLHEPNGTLVGKVEVRWDPAAVVAHPSGAGFVALQVEPVPARHYKVTLHEVGERLDPYASRVIVAEAVGYPRGVPEISVALDAGLVFVRAGLPEGGATLIALRSAGRGVPLVELYRVPIPARTTLAYDRSGRRAFAVVDHPGGLAVADLGPEPPSLPESGPLHIPAPLFEHVNWCAQESEVNSRSIHQYVALRCHPPARRAAAAAEMEAACNGDLPALLILYHALLGGDWRDLAAALLARLQASHPEDPAVLRAPFAMLVSRRAWRELDAALEAAGTSAFPGLLSQHYHHLRATACAHFGDVEAALRHRAAAQRDGYPQLCLHRLGTFDAAFATYIEPSGPPADPLSFNRPTCAQLSAVVRAADACLASGDPAGAIAVLERPVVWDLHEVVSLSRLATAHLALAVTSPEARFRKSLALACFIECVDSDRGSNRNECLAPGLAWPEVRIAELLTEAITWMEAEQGTGRTPTWLED